MAASKLYICICVCLVLSICVRAGGRAKTLFSFCFFPCDDAASAGRRNRPPAAAAAAAGRYYFLGLGVFIYFWGGAGGNECGMQAGRQARTHTRRAEGAFYSLVAVVRVSAWMPTHGFYHGGVVFVRRGRGAVYYTIGKGERAVGGH